MSEKVKLPKDVCDALDYATKHIPSNLILKYTDRCDWRAPETIILNDLSFDTVMQALVLGYEPALSPEEQSRKLFFETTSFRFKSTDDLLDAYRKGVVDAIKAHGINYSWMEDSE